MSKRPKKSSKLCEEIAKPKSGAGRLGYKLAKCDQKIDDFNKYLKEPMRMPNVEDDDKWLMKMLMSKDKGPPIQGDSSMPDLPKITKKRPLVERQDIHRLGAADNLINNMDMQLPNIIQPISKPDRICTAQTQLSSIHFQSKLKQKRRPTLKATVYPEHHVSKLAYDKNEPTNTLPPLEHATMNGNPRRKKSAQNKSMVHLEQHVAKLTYDMNERVNTLPPIGQATMNGVPQRKMSAQKATVHLEQRVSKLIHDMNEPMEAFPPIENAATNEIRQRKKSAQKKAGINKTRLYLQRSDLSKQHQ